MSADATRVQLVAQLAGSEVIEALSRGSTTKAQVEPVTVALVPALPGHPIAHCSFGASMARIEVYDHAYLFDDFLEARGLTDGDLKAHREAWANSALDMRDNHAGLVARAVDDHDLGYVFDEGLRPPLLATRRDWIRHYTVHELAHAQPACRAAVQSGEPDHGPTWQATCRAMLRAAGLTAEACKRRVLTAPITITPKPKQKGTRREQARH